MQRRHTKGLQANDALKGRLSLHSHRRGQFVPDVEHGPVQIGKTSSMVFPTHRLPNIDDEHCGLLVRHS